MHYKTAAGIQKIAGQLRALRIAARLNKVAAQAQHEESHKAGTSGKIGFPPSNPYMDILPRAPYKPNPYLQQPPAGGNLGEHLSPTAFPPAAPPAYPKPSQAREEMDRLPPVRDITKALFPMAFPPAASPTRPNPAQAHEETHAQGLTTPPSPTMTHEDGHASQFQPTPEYRKAVEDYLRNSGYPGQQRTPDTNQGAFAWPFWIAPTPSPAPPKPPYNGNMA